MLHRADFAAQEVTYAQFTSIECNTTELSNSSSRTHHSDGEQAVTAAADWCADFSCYADVIVLKSGPTGTE